MRRDDATGLGWSSPDGRIVAGQCWRAALELNISMAMSCWLRLQHPSWLCLVGQYAFCPRLAFYSVQFLQRTLWKLLPNGVALCSMLTMAANGPKLCNCMQRILGLALHSQHDVTLPHCGLLSAWLLQL